MNLIGFIYFHDLDPNDFHHAGYFKADGHALTNIPLAYHVDFQTKSGEPFCCCLGGEEYFWPDREWGFTFNP
jgi:hypothetical protein